MTRTSINFLLDLSLLLLFCSMIWISFVLRVVFPPATVADGYTLWGGTYDFWFNAQFVLFCIILLGLLLHVMLHWSWVCGVIANRVSRWRGRPMRIDEGSQTIYGVAFMIVLFNIIGVALTVAYLSLTAPSV